MTPSLWFSPVGDGEGNWYNGIMNNRFFGDEGDFYKYCLLRVLAREGFRIGVCWLFTEGEKNGGGEIGYLRGENARRHRDKDPELFDFLRDALLAQKRRDISLLEKARAGGGIIPGAMYFRDVFPHRERENYFRKMLAEFGESGGADLIFLDPDTGIYHRKSPAPERQMDEYIRWEEIERVFRGGGARSLAVFQWFRNPFWRNDGTPLDSIAHHNGILANLRDICGGEAHLRMIRRRHFACYFLMRERHRAACAKSVARAGDALGFSPHDEEIPFAPLAAAA